MKTININSILYLLYNGHKPLSIKCLLQNLDSIRRYMLAAVNRGVNSALTCGPVLGFPVIDVMVSLHWLEVGRRTSETMIAAAASQCVNEVMCFPLH